MEAATLVALCVCAAVVAAFAFAQTGRTQGARQNAFAKAAPLAASTLLAIGLAGATFTPAFANDEAHHDEAVTSSHPGDDSVSTLLGDDIVWAGQNVSYRNIEARNDILAAGQYIDVADSTVAGSIRAAGETINVTSTNVAHGITLAGQETKAKDATAQAVAMAAGTATFSGETNALYAFAETVVINGTVHGDAVVNAQTIELGPNANIEGTLRGSTEHEPDIAAGAHYGTIELAQNDGNAADAAETSFNIAGLFGSVVYGAIACLIMAAVIEWLGRKQVATSVDLAKSRMGYVAASGVIAAIVAPIAIVILCCLVVTLPVASALALALIALTIISGGFAAAVLGKIVFKNTKRFPAAIAMGAIIGAACALPFVGTVLGIACFAFALGCTLQGIYCGLKEQRPSFASASTTTYNQPQPAQQPAAPNPNNIPPQPPVA